MEKGLAVLVGVFALSLLASFFTTAVPPMGLSTTLGISVLGSSVLGSSVLGSSVLGSTVMGSMIMQSYSTAIPTAQVGLSFVLIGMLVYSELTDPAYGKLKRMLSELRKSWLPFSGLLLVLFFIIVAWRVWAVLAA